MGTNKGYTTVDGIINDLQLMMDDTSYDKDAQIYQLRLLALQGVKELNFDASQNIKNIDIKVSSSLQNGLPTDLVSINRIGFFDNDNIFHPISKESDLSFNKSTKAKINKSSFDDNNPYYHTDLGKKFGKGGGQNSLGYYRVSNNKKIINFSSNLANKYLIMEYVYNDKSYVHTFLEEALRCYIYYKYIQHKRNVPANEKQMAKRAYYNEKRLARARMMNFSKEQAMQVSRKAFKQSPKI